jgi:carbonic anhydrase
MSNSGALAKRTLIGGLAVIVLGGLGLALSERAQFTVGGALVNVGYRMQDHLHRYDFLHDEHIAPDDIWTELSKQNDVAARVRETFPRTPRHPVVALVACMDGRIDTNELVGDTRSYYYVVRTAGSVMSEAEQDMLELAVMNGVRLVLLTTHTDCAAEKAASDPALHERFPAMTTLVDEREKRIAEFMERPLIKSRIAEGKLVVKRARIDTKTERLLDEPAVLAHGHP